MKRCVVSGRYMMWSDVQISVGKDGMTQREKKRWNKCINLFLVTDIAELDGGKKSKKNRKFKITIQDQHHHRHQHHHHHDKDGKKMKKKKRKLFVRDYVFRAKNKKWRDTWVNGLKGHIEQIQRERTFMKQSESKYHMDSH